MFVVVNFGYRQNRVYNINCQVGPLLDLVQRQCFADVQQYFTQKQRSFNKDLTEVGKKLEETKGKLHVLEHPQVEEEKKPEAPRGKGRSARKGGAEGKQTSQPPEPQPAEVKAPEPEPPKPDPKAAAKPAPGAAKAKGKKEAVVEELSPEEIARRKLEEEKEQLKGEIAALQDTIAKYNDKLTKMQAMKELFATPLIEIDLADRGGERKYMRSKLEEQANTLLAAKGTYMLVRKKAADVDEFENYTYDGYCVRTPEEDLTFVEEVVETKKGGAKKKK